MATKSVTGRVGVRVHGPILEQPVAENLEIVGFSDMDGKRDALQMDVPGGRRPPLPLRRPLLVGRRQHPRCHRPEPAACRRLRADPERVHLAHQGAGRRASDARALPSSTSSPPPDVDPSKAKSGVRVFDASNPTEPEELAFYEAGGIGVHRSWWNGGDYAYLSAGAAAPGIWMHGAPDMTRIMTILDVSDPKNPREGLRFLAAGAAGRRS